MQASIDNVVAPVQNPSSELPDTRGKRESSRSDLHRIQSVSVVKVFDGFRRLYDVFVPVGVFARKLISRFPHHTELD